jgi:hypothetical protein
MPQNYDTCSPNNTPPTQYVNSTNLGTPVLNYDVSFPYIAATDIVVFTGDTGDWTLRNQGTGANEYAVSPQTGTGTDEVVFVGGTPGANILITRRTDICEAARVFQAGSSIRAQDLNTDMNQLRFLYQELYSYIEMFAGSEGDDLIPGETPDLGDLGNVDTTGAVNRSYLAFDGTDWVDARVWRSTDAFASNDTDIATTQANDDRYLGQPGGGGVALTAGSGIEFTGATNNVCEVDLADTTPGLQFDGNDDLQVIGNSVTEDGADVRLTNGPTDVTITGGANVTVTRNSANQLTIASAAATGGATFRGTVDVDDNNTLPGTAGQQNPNAVAIGDGFTVENNVAAADVTANWNTVLDNWDTGDGIINSGDVILCTTAAAAGSPTDARYNLIRTGGNINTLQQVTDAGNTSTNPVILDDTSLQIQEGTDTLTVNWPTGTANRTISFPDAGGTVALAADVPAAAGNGALTITAGTNLTGAVTGGQFTANKADATTITLDVDDVFVLTAGDTMTGNLVMDTANIQGDVNAITAGAGNFNLNNGNFWTLGAVVVPDPTNMAEGISGLIVNTAAATWPAAGGATFQYAANTPPNITEFPAVIPFYCPNNTTIFIGTPTVNIV